MIPLAPGGVSYISGLPPGTGYHVEVTDGTMVYGTEVEGIIFPNGTAQSVFAALPTNGELVIISPNEEEAPELEEATWEDQPS